MTQTATLPYQHLLGDGTSTVFPYGYFINSATEIEVYLNGVLMSSGYTISGIGSASGGNVTFLAPPAASVVVFHRRVTPQTQILDYIDNDPFGADSSEFELDKLTRMIQDITERMSRIPTLAPSVQSALRNLTLPSPGASKLFGWNSTSDGVTLYDAAISTVTIDPLSGRTFGKTTTVVPTVDNVPLLTATAAIPAGVLLDGVLASVTVTCGASRSLTTWSLGDAAILERWGTGIARTSGTVTNAGYWQAYTPLPYANAGDLLLVADGGLWDGTGSITLTTHWTLFA